MPGILQPRRPVPRLFFSGGFPCCCPHEGSTVPETSSFGSSGGGPPAEDEGPRGSSQIGTANCPLFKDSLGPLVIRVDVEGVIDADCDECELLNGTYYLQGIDDSEADRCIWRLEFAAVCGCYDFIQLTLTELSVGNYAWALQLLAIDPAACLDEITFVGLQATFGMITIPDVSDVLLGLASASGPGPKCDVGPGARAVLNAVR